MNIVQPPGTTMYSVMCTEERGEWLVVVYRSEEAAELHATCLNRLYRGRQRYWVKPRDVAAGAAMAQPA